MRGEVALHRQQRGAHRRDRGDDGGSAGNLLVRQPRIVEHRRVDPPGGGRGGFRICRIGTGSQDQERRRAVELAGIEVGEAEAVGETPRQGALARSGRAVDRDNKRPDLAHAGSAKPAPSRFINGTKSGKLVAIDLASSIRTGSRAASPSTRKAIAMRWSRRGAVRAPPFRGPPLPSTTRASPSAA